MLGPAHIVGISKTAYGLATPRRLEWRHDLRGENLVPPSPPPPCAARCGTRPVRRRHGARRTPPPARRQGAHLPVDGRLAAAWTRGLRARRRPADGEPTRAPGP